MKKANTFLPAELQDYLSRPQTSSASDGEVPLPPIVLPTGVVRANGVTSQTGLIARKPPQAHKAPPVVESAQSVSQESSTASEPTPLQVKRRSRLAEQAVEISSHDAWAAHRVGFAPSSLVQMTLPHREPPRDLAAWGRQQDNGRSLIIQPGFRLSEDADKAGNRAPIGLGYPFGSIPRLILAWVGREVVKTRSRTIYPGESLAGFMRELGITTSNGGERGTVGRVREQVRRLFAARIAIIDNIELINNDPNGTWAAAGFTLADSVETFWGTGTADFSQRSLFESKVVLSEKFFNELLRAPVPLDMRALAALKSSPMALDVYAFLTYRAFSTRSPIKISWQMLHRQFGAEADIGRFRQLFRAALEKVLAVYPQARFDARSATHLLLLPSPTHVRSRSPSARSKARTVADERGAHQEKARSGSGLDPA
jgi:hypothetical protein